jgi:hypothetical protein
MPKHSNNDFEDASQERGFGLSKFTQIVGRSSFKVRILCPAAQMLVRGLNLGKTVSARWF